MQGRVPNKFRIMIKESPDNPNVLLVLQEGLSEADAAEILMMYQADGKTDLVLEEYNPEAHRMGRNPELH